MGMHAAGTEGSSLTGKRPTSSNGQLASDRADPGQKCQGTSDESRG